MEDILKIKLAVADRIYPLSVAPWQEEGYRKAAKRISQMIYDFEFSYELKDKRDALALVAITLANEIEQAKIIENQQDTKINEQLNNIYAIINGIE